MSSPTAGFQYQTINNIFNGSGLSAALNTGDPIPGAGSWPTHSVNQTDLWVADVPGLTWQVTLTLGSVYELAGFHLWNENEAEPGRSSKNYTVAYSTDNVSYTSIASTPSPFLPGTGLATYQGADYGFVSPIKASFVRFTITDDYGSIYAGLSEIRFETTPEPSSVCLAVLGSLGVWGLRRRFNRRGR